MDRPTPRHRHFRRLFRNVALSASGPRPSTVKLYESLRRLHMDPEFGQLPLGRISPGHVRSWNSSLTRRHAVVAGKAYRLFRQIMATAVADEVIANNPPPGEGSRARTVTGAPCSLCPEVGAIAMAMPVDLRIAVLLASWCQLRRAEIIGLEASSDLGVSLERATGIEPAFRAWEARVLPLNYARISGHGIRRPVVAAPVRVTGATAESLGHPVVVGFSEAGRRGARGPRPVRRGRRCSPLRGRPCRR